MPATLILIPTHCEESNIPILLPALLDHKDYHALIIDDASTDKTIEAVHAQQKNYPNRLFLLQRDSKQGIGSALLAGINYALERNYDYIVQMDADLSHDPNDVPKLLKVCQGGYDMVIGSRYIKGINVVNWPIQRILLSYFANQFVQVVIGLPVKDSTAGFACYKQEMMRRINQQNLASFRGYIFQVATKFIVWRSKGKIKEIPVIFTDRKYGKSKLSIGALRIAMGGVLKLILWKYIPPKGGF